MDVRNLPTETLSLMFLNEDSMRKDIKNCSSFEDLYDLLEHYEESIKLRYSKEQEDVLFDNFYDGCFS